MAENTPDRIYDENIENLRHYALTEDRAARAEDTAVKKLATGIIPPGKFRYYVGFFFSIAGDVLDIVNFILIFFYGAGLVIGPLVDIIIDVPLLFLGFKSGKELKKIGAASSAITSKIQSIQQKIATYRRRYAQILRLSRKVKLLRKPVRTYAKKFKEARKRAGKKAALILAKNPVGRFILFMAADLVPFLDLIPFRTIAMWQMYKQEKLAYEQFQEMINEDYPEARAEEVEATNDMLAMEQEELATEVEEAQER